MKVCIVHTIKHLEKGCQLMVRFRTGYNHVYDCKLRTLEECRAIAEAQGWDNENQFLYTNCIIKFVFICTICLLQFENQYAILKSQSRRRQYDKLAL